jgi:hypothetical protein
MNGVLKKYIATPLARKTVKESDIWYDLSELPPEVQESIQDMATTPEELARGAKPKSLGKKINIYDNDEVVIYVNKGTLLLPVVGNLLPNDGTNAYTVDWSSGEPNLKPILICWGCHWSELFTGQTKYKNNVFCLASDLSPEQREYFIDDIITLEDTREFLGIDAELEDSQKSL